MPDPAVFAFKGATSQTGQATCHEFPEIELVPGEPSLAEITDAVKKPQNLGVLPIWNSHVGEIKELQAFELLFQRSAKLLRLWPSTIRFECLISEGASKSRKIRTIVSVHVAEIQCSEFVKKIGAIFMAKGSTVDAYREFCNTTNFDAALCAPGQNQHGFKVFCPDAANPINFTTFVLLGHRNCTDWSPEQWGSWHARLFPATGVFFGVEMPIRTVSLSEDQQQLLSDLTIDASKIDDIPKVVFVSRRREDSCGLLFEANGSSFDGDIITEDGYSARVTVIPEIGVYNKKYSERTYEYLEKEHSAVLERDFVRHIGRKTCFYACPPLQLITHGFEHSVVEPVIKRVIAKYFELYINGMDCSSAQQDFFERHKTEYLDKGPDFFLFQDVGI